MPSVTAMGCSLTCLMGAFVSVAEPLSAAISSLVLFSEAGSRADKLANGPGSFSSLFQDQLSLITPDDFDKCKWVEED
jgi:hydroxyethylthiazole kinase